MSQDVVTFPAAQLARFFDLRWADRPGGTIAAVPLLAAGRIAELHGGRLEVAPGPRGGCRLTLTLPARPLSRRRPAGAESAHSGAFGARSGASSLPRRRRFIRRRAMTTPRAERSAPHDRHDAVRMRSAPL